MLDLIHSHSSILTRQMLHFWLSQCNCHLFERPGQDSARQVVEVVEEEDGARHGEAAGDGEADAFGPAGDEYGHVFSRERTDRRTSL